MVTRTEKQLWFYINGKMSPYWAAQRHEDKHSKGIPDVSFSMSKVNGWIELKTVVMGKSGNVDLSHFTVEQKQWLKRHGRRGGHCFLLIEIISREGNKYIMLDYTKVDINKVMAVSDLIDLSCYNSDCISPPAFMKALLS